MFFMNHLSGISQRVVFEGPFPSRTLEVSWDRPPVLGPIKKRCDSDHDIPRLVIIISILIMLYYDILILCMHHFMMSSRYVSLFYILRWCRWYPFGCSLTLRKCHILLVYRWQAGVSTSPGWQSMRFWTTMHAFPGHQQRCSKAPSKDLAAQQQLLVSGFVRPFLKLKQAWLSQGNTVWMLQFEAPISQFFYGEGK